MVVSPPGLKKQTAGHEGSSTNGLMPLPPWRHQLYSLGGRYPLFQIFKLSESLASFCSLFFLSGVKAQIFKKGHRSH